MPAFASYDGTVLAYTVIAGTDTGLADADADAGGGPGWPLVCLPGGPGRNPVYLGDLGGLGATAGRDLVMLATRGTGDSAVPADTATYRCDRQVGDVEALRAHLGLDRMDLLAHSAAANLAVLYATRYPDRIRRLVLLTPGLHAVGLTLTRQEEEAALALRSGEPWYQDALEARRVAALGRGSVEILRRWAPFYYGRWDAAAQAHATAGLEPRAAMIGARYFSAGAFDPAATRAALARMTAPVLVYAGELDFTPTPQLAARAVGLFPRAELVVQPGGGHMPWLDDPLGLAATIARFLGSADSAGSPVWQNIGP
jgi:pimeloyl-ACP methyl ester carboxylesterase